MIKKSMGFMGSVLTIFPTTISIQSHIKSVVLFLSNGRLTIPLFVVKYYSFGSPFEKTISLNNKYVKGGKLVKLGTKNDDVF